MFFLGSVPPFTHYVIDYLNAGGYERSDFWYELDPAASSYHIMDTQSLLTLNYYFPPRKGSDVRRPGEIYPRLVKKGWDVTTITTVGKKQESVRNGSYRSRYHGVKVIRVDEPGVSSGWKALQGIETIMGLSGSLPGGVQGWFRRMMKTAVAFIREKRIDVLYTPGPPFIQLLIGLHLKKRFGIRWIADFQDAWADNPVMKKYSIRRTGRMFWKVSNKLSRMFERMILEYADEVLFFQRSHPDRYAAKYQKSNRHFHWLPNGINKQMIRPSFDRWDMDANGPIKAGFAGSFYEGFPSLFHSVKQWTRDLIPSLKFRLIGSCSRVYQNRYGDDPNIDFYAHQPQSKMIKLLLECDVLFFLTYRKDNFPQTLPEAVALGKPVWGFAPTGGDAGFLLDVLGGGMVLGIDEQTVKRRLNWFINDGGPTLDLRRNDRAIHQFLWENIADRFEQVIL